jgi:protein disulfide isomerase
MTGCRSSLLLLLLATALWIAVSWASPLPHADSLNFDALIETDQVVLAFFTKGEPCRLCPILEKQLEDAVDLINEAHDRERPLIVKVDSGISNELAVKYGVSTYPSLKLFRRGRELSCPYRGGHRPSEIANHLLDMMTPTSTELTSVAQAHAFLTLDSFDACDGTDECPDDHVRSAEGKESVRLPAGAERAVLVAFYPRRGAKEQTDQLFESEVELRATKLFRFAHTFNANVTAALGGFGKTFVVYRTHADPAVYPASKSVRSGAILEWVANHALPRVAELSGDTAFLYQRSDRPIFRVFTDVHQDAKEMESVRFRLAELAAAFPEIDFTYAHHHEGEEHGADARELDYDTDALEGGAAIAIYHARRKFRPATALARWDSEAVATFCRQHLEKPSRPYLRSAKVVPQDDDANKHVGHVQELVGSNFAEHVIYDPRNVLVLVYAPWCGHCKTLMPVWRELPKIFADAGIESVAVTQVDTTQNEVPPGYNATAFPTIFLGLQDLKDTPLEYQGERTVDRIVDFVRVELAKDRRPPSAVKEEKDGERQEL